MKKMEFHGPHHINILSSIFGSLLGDSHAQKRFKKCRINLQQASSNESIFLRFIIYGVLVDIVMN